MNTMQHEGYLAEIELDESANLLRGIVVNARDLIRFQGETVSDLRDAFGEAIRDFRERYKPQGLTDEDLCVPVTEDHHLQMLRNASIVGRERLGGAPNYVPLQQSNVRLLEGLWFALERYKNAQDDGREGAKLACQFVTQFLYQRWENPELAAPFMGLKVAIEDKEVGGKTLPDISALGTDWVA